ncbi:hypothetical protein VTI28DRAFT_1781 [Corynascus sepedonium]
MSTGLNEDGRRFLAVIIVCPAIAVVASALRMWCKAVTMKSGFRSFHIDDWMIFATTVTYLAAESAIYWGLFDGNRGVEIGELTAELFASPSLEKLRSMENYLESLFIGNTIVCVTFFLAKLSVCLLYRRIFSTQPFRKICLVLMVISALWFVAAQVTNLVTCIPIDSFWHRLKPGKCINFNLFSLIIGIFDILIDVTILILPIRAVLSLQLPTKTKAMVSGIFLLGGFAIITNILRVAYQYQPNGKYVNFGRAEMWLNIHAAVTILCACMPTYKPLRDLAGKFVSTIRDRYGSSVRFLRSGQNTSTSSSGTENNSKVYHYPGGSREKGNGTQHSGRTAHKPYPVQAHHAVYHYPTTMTTAASSYDGGSASSTGELVPPAATMTTTNTTTTPPTYWGHYYYPNQNQYQQQYGVAGTTAWYETDTSGGGNGDDHLVPPPGTIARTTRVDIV